MTRLLNGDCLQILKTIEGNSIDSLMTDPPAGIKFMGKAWDDDKGGRNEWIAWMTEVMKECMRVLKPGAHGLVWAIPRTSHWTATALEDAGFEVRDVVTHLFGSGFPKSMDISKAIDKQAGAEREVVGKVKKTAISTADTNDGWSRPSHFNEDGTHKTEMNITAPSTPEAKQWQGWGTALKPASEHWILVRKPCSEKTVASNVLKHGTGGLNIDASRVEGAPLTKETPIGRFPANLVLSHNDDCIEVGMKKIKAIKGGNSKAQQKDIYGKFNAPLDGVDPGYGDADGTETVSAFECTPGCAVAELDKQGQTMGVMKSKTIVNPINDSGGVSRFFYCAKASKRDKGADNTHPTVKSTKLMSYLIKLITPPHGIVLDPFMGSGSTGVAAKRDGFRFIGIEQSRGYMEITQKRLGSMIPDFVQPTYFKKNELE